MKEKNISRASFLKGSLSAAASAALLGVSAFGSEGEGAQGIYKPGTYSATATGMGTVTVTATFDENSLIDVVLDLSEETENIGRPAGEELTAQLLAAQSSEIEGVSGASITTQAVRTAMANCIAQAKGEAVSSGSVKPEVASEGGYVLKDLLAEDINASAVILEPITDFGEEVDADVVVCGAGAAGVTAAVHAAELGARVVLLQKEPIVVSQGNCSSAIVKGGSTEAGLKKWICECTAFNSYRSNPALLQAYIDRSEEALRFVCERGGITEETEWKNEKTGVSKYQDTSGVFTGLMHDGTQTYDFGEEKVEIFAPWFGPKPNNYGTLMAGILDEAMANLENLTAYFSTPVVQLLKDEAGAIIGCVGQKQDGSFLKVNAHSVILATGAYENNQTMVRRFCPDIERFDKKVYHRTGDGNILAIEAGGAMEPVAHSKVMHDFDAGLMWDEPTFLNVNMNGERFINEEVEMAYISNQLRYQPSFQGENMDPDHASGSQGWYCQIYDNDYMSYATGPVPEAVMARYLKEEDPSLHVSVFPELIDTFRADTIEELAEKLGIPAENAAAAVARYNEICEAGLDTDFGKKSEYLHALKTAPFWGIRRHIRCSSITAGVLTDEFGRVVTEEGEVVKGLYAVGNLGGQFFGAPDYPFFQGGLSLGHAVTFGYIAGEHAAKGE